MLPLVLCLPGCTANPDLLGQAFVSPGRYSLYDCPRLATERTNLTAKESELRGLIAKAETGVGGQFIAEAAYGSDYATARQNLQAVSAAQAESHCDGAAR
jgi:hypothetical protein